MKKAKQYLIEKWPARFKKTGLTQQKFADKINLSRQSVNKILRAKSINLRAETIDAVEKAFEELGV